MKVKFSLLSIEDTASILDWSSKQTGGILPLSEGTFNLYLELKDKIDLNKDNTKLICNIIKDKIKKFNQDNKDVIERYKLLWNKYNDRFIKAMEDIFQVTINKDINAKIGLLPVCPRNIEDLSFSFDLCDDDSFIEICMHEICHFYFFEKCKQIFNDWKYIDFDNPSLLWYLSEIVIDPILNRDEVQNIFKHGFKSYDNFYDINIDGVCIVDFIRNIFYNKDIDDAIKEGLHFLQNNGAEFRKKCDNDYVISK